MKKVEPLREWFKVEFRPAQLPYVIASGRGTVRSTRQLAIWRFRITPGRSTRCPMANRLGVQLIHASFVSAIAAAGSNVATGTVICSVFNIVILYSLLVLRVFLFRALALISPPETGASKQPASSASIFLVNSFVDENELMSMTISRWDRRIIWYACLVRMPDPIHEQRAFSTNDGSSKD